MKKQILSLSFLLFTSIAFAQIKVAPGYITIGGVTSMPAYYTTPSPQSLSTEPCALAGLCGIA